nr:MAG TPA: YopX protein [Caudoviricetes sp.]
MIPRYRGLSIDENSKGKMQYGYLIADGEQTFIINEVVEANEQYITIGSWCPVDPKTVGQSTGLKDKNGKEIFEKDILDYNGRKVIVKWHGSYASFIYEFVDELQNRTTEWQPLYLSYYKFEVIGNSLENPELLEVTE